MGMYDNLIISRHLLPLRYEDFDYLTDIDYVKLDWQTKSFDNNLSNIYIEDDKRLYIEKFDYEEVPKEERPYPDDIGIFGLCGSLRKTNISIEPLDYHGYVRFYTNIKNIWFEYEAKFTDGLMVDIKRVINEYNK